MRHIKSPALEFKESIYKTTPIKKYLPPIIPISNLSGLKTIHGRMYLTCPVCFIGFSRFASHVARTLVSCCSRACASEIRKVRVEVFCVVCKASMEVIPSNITRVTTCSNRCSRIRRSVKPEPRFGLPEYKKAANKVSERGQCKKCYGKHGPWVVRGLMPEGDKIFPSFNTAKAELWCRRCHLNDVQYWDHVND